MPEIEVRPCANAGEMAQFRWLVRYVFANNKSDAEDAEGAGIRPEWTTCAFVDGTIAMSMAALPFRVKLNGAPVRMAGVTCVGTSPAFRRRGLLRRAMTDGLAKWRDEGNAFAILWASMGSIYQRFGYGLASTHVKYDFDPRNAVFAQNVPVAGTIEQGEARPMFDTLRDVYQRATANRNLVIERSRALWDAEPLHPAAKDHPVFAAVYRDVEGVPQGYLVYRQSDHEQHDGGRSIDLDIRDLWWTNIEAYRALWQFVNGHDLAFRVSAVRVAEDDPLPHLVLEPRLLHRATGDGIWMRVTDAEAALAQRPYEATGRLTVGVSGDEMCPWNNGSYAVEAGEGGATVRRTDRAADIMTSPNGLASLISGHASASQLSRWGMLEADGDAARVQADRMFATKFRPHGPDAF